jgi:hypothetical protein
MSVNSLIFDAAKIMPKIGVPDWEPEQWVRNEIIMMNNFLSHKKERKIVDDAQRLGISYNKLLPMNSRYTGESIYYAGPIDRMEAYQIFTYEGKLYDKFGLPLNTKPLDFNSGAILVMTEEGVLFLSHKDRGIVHHSTFIASLPVAYACMLEVQDGNIIREEVWSGHYEPTEEHQAQFHDRLHRNCSISIPKEQMIFFLWSGLRSRDETLNILDCQPLLEPVVLPCGDIFNYSSLIRSTNANGCCPYHEGIKPADARFDKTIYQNAVEKYRSHFYSVQSTIKDLDQKVISQKLDDRKELFNHISTISKTPKVMLLLDENTLVSRLQEIWKSLWPDITNMPAGFMIDNGYYRNLNVKLLEIPEYRSNRHLVTPIW